MKGVSSESSSHVDDTTDQGRDLTTISSHYTNKNPSIQIYRTFQCRPYRSVCICKSDSRIQTKMPQPSLQASLQTNKWKERAGRAGRAGRLFTRRPMPSVANSVVSFVSSLILFFFGKAKAERVCGLCCPLGQLSPEQAARSGPLRQEMLTLESDATCSSAAAHHKRRQAPWRAVRAQPFTFSNQACVNLWGRNFKAIRNPFSGKHVLFSHARLLPGCNFRSKRLEQAPDEPRNVFPFMR